MPVSRYEETHLGDVGMMEMRFRNMFALQRN